MINLPFTKNKTYYVVGLGKSNQAAIKALKKAGADVRVWDDTEKSLKGFADKMITPPDKAPWSKIKAVVMAPGISPSHPVVQMAAEKNVPVLCDVDLFAQSKPNCKVIGVTGTNGKSTVTALIHHILNFDGKSQCGGNIGEPVLGLKQRADYTVLELSSYQLDRSPNLACDVAVLLNITKDHLDWHEGMENYIAAKKKIFDNADYKIISIDDDNARRVFEAEEGAKPLSVFIDESPFNPIDMPKMKGQHNVQNMLAAYYTCEYLGISHDVIVERLKSFNGLPHRQYLVKNIDGVPYINDSKATNAEAAKMALQSFRNILWIAGGEAKEGGLTSLEGVFQNIHQAFLYGVAAEEFAKFLSSRGVEIDVFETLGEATMAAHMKAQNMKGEPTGAPTVLLSPACASFDQFDNFEQRGEAFVELVGGLDN